MSRYRREKEKNQRKYRDSEYEKVMECRSKGVRTAECFGCVLLCERGKELI